MINSTNHIIKEPTKTLEIKEIDYNTYYLDYYEKEKYPFCISKDEKIIRCYQKLKEASEIFKTIK